LSTSVALLCTMMLASSPAPARAQLTSIGVHSMLYLNDPSGAKQAMFREAAALGASSIRLDIELSGVFLNPSQPDWSGVDEYMLLARRYHLRVLAVLTATPWYMVDCPPATPPNIRYKCPPSDPSDWGADAGLIAAHTRGVIDCFEILNEPDGAWSFRGTPEQYAQILAASYQAIHAADPAAQVALGGLMNAASHTWMNAMLNTPGTDAIHSFDIANIHTRTSVSRIAGVVRSWRQYFAGQRFPGPLWVTETGYPADPAYQTDHGYRNGPASQAQWMTAAITAVLGAGAAVVFVTERDAMGGRYASEGILDTPDPLPADPPCIRRPSYYAVRALIEQGG
jgi:hypothetical protein